MSVKVRDYVRASSLGSYFGVGYNDPKDQFLIDTGQAVEQFDEASQDRMNLGSYLENATLDFFANKFGVEIVGRNIKTKTFLDGMLVGKMDGEYVDSDGKKVIVENKISNSQSGVFTENLGYHIQVQSYLLDHSYDYALLCGLYQGKPVFKFIYPDEAIQADIQEMVTFVTSAMMGLLDFDQDFPRHLFEKYAKKQVDFLPIDDIPLDEVMKMERLIDLKQQVKSLEKEIDALDSEIKNKYSVGKIKTDKGTINISEGSRKGFIDEFALAFDNPELDLEQYRKPSSTFRSIRVSGVKE
jgi:hypothetical protein